MKIIGVVGGIASGKSEITRMLESLGAVRIDADRLGHLALEDDRIRATIVSRWGADVISEGKLSRKQIAQRVFGRENAAELRFLEETTHPFIRDQLEQKIETARGQQAKAVVIDAALLLKAGWDERCDRIIFVDVPLEVRQARAMKRNWTIEQFAAREAAQLSLNAKRKRAQSMIDNSGSLEETFDQVQLFWDRWIEVSE